MVPSGQRPFLYALEIFQKTDSVDELGKHSYVRTRCFKRSVGRIRYAPLFQEGCQVESSGGQRKPGSLGTGCRLSRVWRERAERPARAWSAHALTRKQATGRARARCTVCSALALLLGPGLCLTSLLSLTRTVHKSTTVREHARKAGCHVFLVSPHKKILDLEARGLARNSPPRFAPRCAKLPQAGHGGTRARSDFALLATSNRLKSNILMNPLYFNT